MEIVDQDLLIEQNIENYIPARHASVVQMSLLIVLIAFVGSITLFLFLPNPETLRGKAFVIDKNQALIYLLASRTGEIESGMKVYVYLENYKQSKYGYLPGVVAGFANDGRPNEDGYYCVTVKLPQGLRTSLGCELDNRISLQGEGEIFISEQSVLESICKVFVGR